MKNLTLLFKLLLLFTLLPSLTTTQLYSQSSFVIRGRVTEESKSKPLSHANITIVGTLLGTTTKENGEYRIILNPGDYEMLIQYVGYKTKKERITVTNKDIKKNFVLEKDMLNIDEVVVVGTRTSARILIESPAPVDIIQTQELETGGLTETNQIIQMLIPAFNFPRPTINDGTDHVRPATLRGLNPDQTLVLVNGIRRHPSALLSVQGSVGRGTNAVDLNTIPSNAIERVEILRDGASALYGSDAIAGVINFVLKSRPESRLSATIGQTKEGDGKVFEIQGNYGLSFSDIGFLHLSGEYRHRGPTNRSGPDTRQQYFSIIDTMQDGSVEEYPDPRELTFQRINHRLGDAKTDDINLFLNSSFPISSNLSLFAFGSFNYRTGEAAGFYRRSLDDRNIRSFYPDGFLPLIKSKILDASFALGIKGTISKWLWNFSNVWGGNSFNFIVDNSVNVSMGTDSPTSFDAGTLQYQHFISSLDILRTINLGFYSPVNIAFGLGFRLENYQIKAGENESYINGGIPVLDGPNAGDIAPVGSQVFPGFRPSDESSEWRNNIAFYIDLESYVAKNLLLGIAGRFENYSDFGSAINGKAAFRFEPINNLAFRGTISSGFKSPSLVQINYSSTSTSFIDGIPYEIRTFPVNDPVAQVLGAVDLKPEISHNINLGIVTNPFENMILTFDYYRIYLNDRIIFSNFFTGDEIRQILEQNGIVGVNGGEFLTNAVDTRTQGLDIILKTGMNISLNHNFTFTSGLNLSETVVTRVSDTPPQLEGLDEPLVGRQSLGRIVDAQPNHRLMLMLIYNWGAFSIMARTNWFGAITLRHWADPERDQTFGAKWITDLDFSYSIGNKFTIGLGSHNMFDVYPDKYKPFSSIDVILPYTGYSPFGFNGAYYYARINVTL
jgi:iron complex outermembrane receptor protein